MGEFKRFRTRTRRLENWDYSTPGGYFVTICTKQKEPFLGKIIDSDMHLSIAGKIVAEEWERTGSLRESVEIDEYVTMPNHLHGIVILHHVVETPRWGVLIKQHQKSATLGIIINQFKSVRTRKIRASGIENFAWQSRYYDHIIRDEIDLHRIRKYIHENPTKWTLDNYYCK